MRSRSCRDSEPEKAPVVRHQTSTTATRAAADAARRSPTRTTRPHRHPIVHRRSGVQHNPYWCLACQSRQQRHSPASRAGRPRHFHVRRAPSARSFAIGRTSLRPVASAAPLNRFPSFGAQPRRHGCRKRWSAPDLQCLDNWGALRLQQLASDARGRDCAEGGIRHGRGAGLGPTCLMRPARAGSSSTGNWPEGSATTAVFEPAGRVARNASGCAAGYAKGHPSSKGPSS